MLPCFEFCTVKILDFLELQIHQKCTIPSPDFDRTSKKSIPNTIFCLIGYIGLFGLSNIWNTVEKY